MTVDIPERFLPEGISSAGFDPELLARFARENNHPQAEIPVKPWVLWYLVEQHLHIDKLARLGKTTKLLESIYG
jgi:hypothetical protein